MDGAAPGEAALDPADERQAPEVVRAVREERQSVPKVRPIVADLHDDRILERRLRHDRLRQAELAVGLAVLVLPILPVAVKAHEALLHAGLVRIAGRDEILDRLVRIVIRLREILGEGRLAAVHQHVEALLVARHADRRDAAVGKLAVGTRVAADVRV